MWKFITRNANILINAKGMLMIRSLNFDWTRHFVPTINDNRFETFLNFRFRSFFFHCYTIFSLYLMCRLNFLRHFFRCLYVSRFRDIFRTIFRSILFLSPIFLFFWLTPLSPPPPSPFPGCFRRSTLSGGGTF